MKSLLRKKVSAKEQHCFFFFISVSTMAARSSRGFHFYQWRVSWVTRRNAVRVVVRYGRLRGSLGRSQRTR